MYFALQAVDAALKENQTTRALILSLRLNEDSWIKKCILGVSPADIPAVASSIPVKYIQRLVEALAYLLENCPHMEFILQWCQVYYQIRTPLALSYLDKCCTHLSVFNPFSCLVGTLQNPRPFYSAEFQKVASCSKIIREGTYQIASRFG